MAKKIYAAYDICMCNHESMSHDKGFKDCFFKVPVGKQCFRGSFPLEWKTEKCICTKFIFSQFNTANPKPSLQGDN